MRGYTSGSTDIVYLWLDCSRQRKQERHEWKVSCSSRWKIKNRTEGEFVDSLLDSAFHSLTRGTGEIYYKNCLATVAYFIACEFSSLWIIYYIYILIVFIYISTVLLLLFLLLLYFSIT